MIESPYAGDRELHDAYLAHCVKHSLDRGEAPFASHGFYTQHLDDGDSFERQQGLDCRNEWASVAEVIRFYCDLGMSPGMWQALVQALDLIEDTSRKQQLQIEFCREGEVRPAELWGTPKYSADFYAWAFGGPRWEPPPKSPTVTMTFQGVKMDLGSVPETATVQVFKQEPDRKISALTLFERLARLEARETDTTNAVEAEHKEDAFRAVRELIEDL